MQPVKIHVDGSELSWAQRPCQPVGSDLLPWLWDCADWGLYSILRLVLAVVASQLAALRRLAWPAVPAVLLALPAVFLLAVLSLLPLRQLLAEQGLLC